MTNKLTCNEIDPAKIARLLTQSTRELDEGTLSALVSARQNAMKRQLVREPEFALNPAYGRLSARWADGLIPQAAHPWIAVVLLIAIIFAGTSYWQHVQEQQIEELDVAILTDDLPIEVFVD
jgi:hypothetical protein